MTGSSGQNSVLAGGLQPLVIPAVASFPMSAAKVELAGTSEKPWWLFAVSPSMRTMNAAICARVTGSSGQ